MSYSPWGCKALDMTEQTQKEIFIGTTFLLVLLFCHLFLLLLFLLLMLFLINQGCVNNCLCFHVDLIDIIFVVLFLVISLALIKCLS